MNVIIRLLADAIHFGAPLLFGTTGEIVTEKSGGMNLGVEGTMAVGAIGGYLMACYTDSLLLGIIFAFIFGGLCGLLFAFLTTTLKANQNVTGLAMTIFGVGIYQLIGEKLMTAKTFPGMPGHLAGMVSGKPFGGLSEIPYIGTLLFSHNILVYLAVLTAVAVFIYMRKTKAGLRMRAVGENPEAADSVGVNVSRVKYINGILGSGITGIGGLYMATVINSGVWSDAGSWIAGYGWISVALVIFASWSPLRALYGSLVFGFLIAVQSKIDLLVRTFPAVLTWMSYIPQEVYKLLPFLITALILILNSIKKKKEGIQPAGCGINYFREER
ncbi:MAG: ABC transporter permease [Clostridiales bacterium]|jgi:simple sugar transport system permease protein|nr:ABC transporter permease [Clostridiales bacterium]